jgi:uncharacterized protein YqgC (DUF456 family)
MEKLKELIKSRKFWAAVFAAALAIWGFFAGEVTAEMAIGAVIVVVGFWQTAQSRVDAARNRG